MSRPPYPPEFRRQMVELIRAGRTPEELAAEFEPTAQSIRNWVAQADRDDGRHQDGLTSAEKGELARLRREVRQLREEQEILKKGRRFSSRPGDGSAEVKYRLIDAEKTHHGVCLLARLLGVSCQGYYAGRTAARPGGDGLRCGADRNDRQDPHSVASHLRRPTRPRRAAR